MIQDGKLRGFAMGQAIAVRTDYTAGAGPRAGSNDGAHCSATAALITAKAAAPVARR
jgi:hypothetical protein